MSYHRISVTHTRTQVDVNSWFNTVKQILYLRVLLKKTLSERANVNIFVVAKHYWFLLNKKNLNQFFKVYKKWLYVATRKTFWSAFWVRLMWYYICHGSLLWLWFRDYHMRFQVVDLSTTSVPTLYLKDPQMGDDTNYPQLLTVGVICWSLLATQRQKKKKKNVLLTINNYLLKQNGVTIIYPIIYNISKIFIERNCRFCRIWETEIVVFGWRSFSILFNFSERGFCWRGFNSWRYFFSYSLVFGMDIGSFLLINPKNIYFLLRFPLGTNIPDWLTNHRSFCILLLLFDWSGNQMCWSTSMRRVSLPRIRFWLVIQSNHNIGAWLIKDPSPSLVGEYFFSL